MLKTFKNHALVAARTIDDKKGEHVVVLDSRKSSPLTDYLVLANANSRPHFESLEKAVAAALAENGLRVHRRAKPQTDAWRVLDFGGLIVHLMSAEARALYALEKLHEGAKEIRWRT